MSSEGLPVDGVVGTDIVMNPRSTQQATDDAKSSLSADSAAQSADAAFKFSRQAKGAVSDAEGFADRAEAAAGIALSGSDAYTNVSEAQQAIDSGKETRDYFAVWSNNYFYWVDKYLNDNGIAKPTGESLFADGFINLLNDFNVSVGLGLSGQWKANENPLKTVLVADSADREIIYSDHEEKTLVAYGKKLADQVSVDNLGSQTWVYHGADNEKIVLLSDLSGRDVVYADTNTKTLFAFGREVGTEAVKPYIPPSFLPELLDERNFGQSLSIYLLGSPGIATPTNNTIMFNTGVVTYQKTPASFAELPTPTTNQYQQSQVHDFQQKVPDASNCKFLLACSGVSGAPMSEIEPGTMAYIQLIMTMETAKYLADNDGMQYGMIGFNFQHGEADAYQGTGYAYYRPKMAVMQSTTNEHAKRISKLPHDVPMFIYQMASHGRYKGLVYPSYETPLAQLDEALENPLIQLATPMYIFEYADGVHLTADGYRHRDLFFSKARRYWFQNGKPWKPMHMQHVSRCGVSTLVGDVFVPKKGKMQFSTSTVSAATDGMHGLELWSESQSGVLTRLPITEVSTLGDAKLKVRSGVNFGVNDKIYLAYAFTPENQGDYDGEGRYPSWNAGPVTGVRGNICDEDDEISDLVNLHGNPYDLRNYMCIFKKEAV